MKTYNSSPTDNPRAVIDLYSHYERISGVSVDTFYMRVLDCLSRLKNEGKPGFPYHADKVELREMY